LPFVAFVIWLRIIAFTIAFVTFRLFVLHTLLPTFVVRLQLVVTFVTRCYVTVVVGCTLVIVRYLVYVTLVVRLLLLRCVYVCYFCCLLPCCC